MSYCRWSSDNWRCDLYCYEDVSGGITTHIAENRIVGDIPKAPLSLIMEGKNEEFLEAHRKQMAFLETAKRESIGLPYDGETFNDPDYASFFTRLIELREVGYNFPDYVLEQVRDDIKQGNEVESSS